MDVVINNLIAYGTRLCTVIDEQIALLKAEGFEQDNLEKLKAAVLELNTNEKAQSAAVNQADKKVTAKDKIIRKATNLVRRLREAAHGAFEDDPKRLKPFQIEKEISKGVDSLCSFLEYLGPIAETEIATLSKNGFNQPDLTELLGLAQKIRIAASEKRIAVKAQKAATIIRNDSATALEKLIKKVRRFVSARFSEQPEILVLFEPDERGRRRETEEEKPADVNKTDGKKE